MNPNTWALLASLGLFCSAAVGAACAHVLLPSSELAPGIGFILGAAAFSIFTLKE